MDDPWGDGWAADAVDQGPVLALPGQAHLAGSGGGTVLVARKTAAPWYRCSENDEAAWGALPLFKAVGPLSPGPWAAVSPLDTAVASFETTRNPVDTARSTVDTTRSTVGTTRSTVDTTRSTVDTARSPVETATQHKHGSDAIDSAISLSEHGDELACAQAAWADAPVVARHLRRPESLDAAAGPCLGTRRASSGLESVDMYEGMARPLPMDVAEPHEASSPTSHPDRDTGPTTHRIEAQDTPSITAQHSPTSHDPTTITETHATTTAHDPYTRPATRLNTSRPSTPFSIDLSLLDTIFPTSPNPSSPPPAEPLPTSILQDSFTSVSERKAWYRISRLGSLRQHRDATDADSYVRVRWAGSCVREHTLDIVRRWKHEDTAGQSKSGLRAGGGAVGFNWDVESPPVEIGKLLRQQQRLRSDQSSLVSSEQPIRRQSVPEAPVSQDSVPPLSQKTVVLAPDLAPALPSITPIVNRSPDSSQREKLGNVASASAAAAPTPHKLPPEHTNPALTTRDTASQKAEPESASVDEIIVAILDTIPDLSYMLR